MRNQHDVKARRPAFSVPNSRADFNKLGTTGNESVAPWPQTLPGAGTVSAPEAPPAGNSMQLDMQFPLVQRIFDVPKYGQFQSISYAIQSGQTLELISEPSGIRTFLAFRSDATSTGTLAIALNQQPQNVAQSNWDIDPGETQDFPTAVPQNRIFGTALGGLVQVTVTWMNWNAPS